MKKHTLKQRLAVGLAFAVATAPMALADDPATPAALISDAKDQAILVVAAGGVALGLIALARVGWAVATKWVKRATGAA